MLTTLFLSQKNEKDLQQLLNIVESKSKEKGLELNSKKTEVMVISPKEEPPLINITINGIKLKQRDHFKYLGAFCKNSAGENDVRENENSPNKLSYINSNKKKNP